VLFKNQLLDRNGYKYVTAKTIIQKFGSTMQRILIIEVCDETAAE
jgi:hypothetical protein